MGRVARMEGLLRAALAPEFLAVEDESGLHEGHAGARPEGETHYHVTIVAAAFAGRSRVERQRVVHAALASEFAAGMHALRLTLSTPEEARAAAGPV